MTDPLDARIPGYDIPALPGMALSQVQTPALLLDLDALERNIRRMGDLAAGMGVRHRSHGKMHKSVDVQKLQERLGGACGVCCQKVSEAEAFARGGIGDILVTNQVTHPDKIARLATLPHLGARIGVCVDDLGNVADLAVAARAVGSVLDCLVEIDAGSGRCGVATPDEAVILARAIAAQDGLRYGGVQAYHGGMQHLHTHAERAEAATRSIARTAATVAALTDAGVPPDVVTGAGTGSFGFEGTSGLYTELQCGSYAFMDADYGRLLNADGARLDAAEWDNALFVLTAVMSVARPGRAVVDAGHKASAIDSGLPVVFGRGDLQVLECSDEHAVLDDPHDSLALNDRLLLIPGHCDPTCNLHDWYVGVRGDRVEVVWPITARGKGY